MSGGQKPPIDSFRGEIIAVTPTTITFQSTETELEYYQDKVGVKTAVHTTPLPDQSAPSPSS